VVPSPDADPRAHCSRRLEPTTTFATPQTNDAVAWTTNVDDRVKTADAHAR
jgi:hypothetical protein